MTETETKELPYDYLLPRYINIALITSLIEESHLTSAVKEHCKMGLKIIALICADFAYKTERTPLIGKEFDAFFKLFPQAYFNNRELISTDLIIKSIQLCISTEDLVHINCE
ncbi:hypothetical protein [Flavivirga jejuensis]|uniref:Uncharacterized protein n=1 Tax=Flavivirga jejuensis TaxID=870487 RepID=A0ABT8WIS0_9FLAO|nr:hypothetical protein [Flavivirga jejuensis]MDO5972866.1 hypothetical protein [Flavivirga jejuensis]